MRHKILTVDKMNANGRSYPRKEVEKMLAVTLEVPCTVGVGSTDEMQSMIGGKFVDLKIEDDKLMGTCRFDTATPAGKTLEILENESDFVAVGNGMISQNGVVSEWKLDYISAVPKGDGA